MDRSSLLVEPDWLVAHLHDPEVRILDCRYYFDERDGYREYQAGHIPGARYFDWTKVTVDPNDSIAYRLAPSTHIAQRLGELGIGNHHLIVGYDDEGGHFVARLWLAFAYYGCSERLRILNGGWTRWCHEGYPTSCEEPQWNPEWFTFPSEFPIAVDLVVDRDGVRKALGNPEVVLLDVRRLSEYTGEEVRAQRGGHIPGARHWFWQEGLVWDGLRTFREPQEIRERVLGLGITPETPVITYCHGGVRAAHAALSLRMAGFVHVRVYVGSWAEWGNCLALPIALGKP